MTFACCALLAGGLSHQAASTIMGMDGDMEIILNSDLIEQLSSKGVLAYLAVSLAGATEATTAALAGLVKAQTGVISAGLKELTATAPELVARARNPKTGKLNNKWCCGVIKAEEGTVLQNLDSERYRIFVDDLKKYWDYLNPEIPFSMNGKEGVAIRRFLSDHSRWERELWVKALKNRILSAVNFRSVIRTEPIWVWVGRLDDYAAGPINKFHKPAEGDGKHGEAVAVQDRNREAAESYLNRHRGTAEA